MTIAAEPSLAQQYPSRSITLIIPYPPNGTSDIVGRALAGAAQRELGVSIQIINAPGDSGTKSTIKMSQDATPDGYTVAMLPSTVFQLPHSFNPVFQSPGAFTFIIGVAGIRYGLVSPAKAIWRNWDQFLAYIKSHPGEVTYSSPGLDQSMRFAMEEITAREETKIKHIAVGSGAQTLVALLGGKLDAAIVPMSTLPQLTQSGSIRVLAMLGPTRSILYPEVPTLKERGFDLVVLSPFGIAGPKGMDSTIVERLHNAFQKAATAPEFLGTLSEQWMEPWYLNSSDYERWAIDQFGSQKRYIEKYGIKP